jgi:hypothetical protein
MFMDVVRGVVCERAYPSGGGLVAVRSFPASSFVF